MRTLLLLAILIPSAAQPATLTLFCLGDSNTMHGQPDAQTIRDSWCDLIAAQHPEWDVRNLAVAGMRIDEGADQELTFGLFGPPPLLPFVVIAAFGTNDVRDPSYTAARFISTARALKRRVARLRGELLVALVPPLFGGWATPTSATDIPKLNARVARLFKRRSVDFSSGFTRADMPVFHVNQSGQVLRAQRALEAIERAQQ